MCFNFQGLIQYMKSTKLKTPDPESIKPYVDKCAELCWYMFLPSHPLYLPPKETTGSIFDKNKYRFYQTTGTKYKFIVWPALYLHKDGSMLSKGIAEGMWRVIHLGRQLTKGP